MTPAHQIVTVVFRQQFELVAGHQVGFAPRADLAGLEGDVSPALTKTSPAAFSAVDCCLTRSFCEVRAEALPAGCLLKRTFGQLTGNSVPTLSTVHRLRGTLPAR
jgi:hypothetical protein